MAGLDLLATQQQLLFLLVPASKDPRCDCDEIELKQSSLTCWKKNVKSLTNLQKFSPKSCELKYWYSESRLMWSHFNVQFNKDYWVKIIGYCNHSVNVITFGLAKVIPLSGFYCKIKSSWKNKIYHMGVVVGWSRHVFIPFVVDVIISLKMRKLVFESRFLMDIFSIKVLKVVFNLLGNLLNKVKLCLSSACGWRYFRSTR